MFDFEPDSDDLDEIVNVLAQKFDTVQIFVTRHDHETGATLAGEWAAGNYYARRGQVAEWLESDPPEDAVRLFDSDSDVN